MNDLYLIKGLSYVAEYIDDETEKRLWAAIQAEAWLGDLKRRVQHYGFKYDYKARAIDSSMRIGDLPIWAQGLAERLRADGYCAETANQLIVNEYEAGQGIASHVDCEPCFGDTIVSVSLGSGCVMDFIHKQTAEKVSIYLEPRSAVILQGDARYLWTHGIAARKSDLVQGQKRQRGTRISLTFRNVLLAGRQ